MRTIFITAFLLGLPSPAAADCGSSSDDDSDSCPVDWSYDDDDDDDGDAAPARPRCREVSLTLGRSQCRRYGDGWNIGAPAFRLTIGVPVQRIRIGHMSFSGQTSHDDQSHPIGSAGRDLDDADLLAGGLLLRLDLTFLDYVSAGIEASITGSDVSGPSRLDGPVRTRPLGVLQGTLGLVLGAAIPIDVVTIRPEVFIGGRFVALRSETRLDDCVNTASAIVPEGVIEPRLAVEVFVTRQLGVSGYVGSNVISPGEVNVGLSLTLHTRAYDAQPR